MTANAQGDALRATIMHQRSDQLPQLIGPAGLARSSEHNVTLRFKQSAIGTPATIAFAVEATKPGCRAHSAASTPRPTRRPSPRSSCAAEAPRPGRDRSDTDTAAAQRNHAGMLSDIVDAALPRTELLHALTLPDGPGSGMRGARTAPDR